jgi:menaquinone-dependent protoporphyrinogen oxidase
VAHTLIVYSTTDGQTLRICQCLQEVVQQGGHQVTLVDIVQAGACDLQRYDAIVIGASIHYGKHAPIVLDFVKRHCALLGSRPSAFFSVNVVARKPNKNTPATNPYLQKFLRQIAWRPDHLAVFAGKINYPIYGPLDRLAIRLIMWMTNGPTAPDAVVEFTDWDQVRVFGRVLATGLQVDGKPADRPVA